MMTMDAIFFLGDSMNSHDGMEFSTLDRDNDRYSGGSCPVLEHSGWWFDNCRTADLNAQYYNSYSVSNIQGILWHHWHGHRYSLKATEMMIKRK